MSLPARLSSLLLATSLLFTGACTHATKTTSSGVGTTGPVHAKVVRRTDPAPIDRAKLRTAMQARRKQTVLAFLAYRDAGVYPINTYTDGLQHVWLDELGHLCAAATVISADWGYDATASVALDDNFVKLADVTSGPLAEWMLTSGLTHHEIVAIQEPMEGPGGGMARMQDPAVVEQQRLYAIYTSVSRQIDQLWDESLDEAVDALMAHEDLARAFLDGQLPGAGEYGA